MPAETPVTRTRFPSNLTPDSTSSVVDVAPNIFAIFFLPHCGHFKMMKQFLIDERRSLE
jgi:hypothetical protein